MGLLSSVSDFLGGGGSKNTTATSTVDPWGPQQPYIKQTFSEAQKLYNQPGPSYYPGSTVADWNPYQTAGLEYMTGTQAPTQAYLGANSANALNTAYASANPLMNPYFASTAQAMINPATQALMRQVLPGIDSGAVLSGNVGSSRQGIAQANAVNDYTQNVLNALSTYGSNAYGAGLDTLSRGLSVAPSISQMQGLPGQTYIGAGDYQRAYEQQLIDAAQQRWNYNQELPYNKLNYYAGIVGNPAGSTTTASQGGGGSKWDSAIGGAASGAAIGGTVLPGWGAPIGGAIGGLLGYFGG